ncbi:SpoIIE family protein phosphatase [Pseudodesulfovibrio sp. S3]|uniref:PP2C family protein-serine/threonine phosphatase n=2 Tax=unclassified Pseudodesulfovibrio TaxID=2661612 RepID=UPI001F4F3576|nr:SpoIIE family protein phosphatase [Pseudodesulfovibrio sp. S3]MCJ2163375.1 SpoIIE family protein phosphatase [Pseudodesulfovibrio sp. S3-i]
MSHVVALRNIRELNEQCRLLKQGSYTQLDLPSADCDGHDFLTLKRNMHWMGHSIAVRELKLQKAMSDLAAAQHQVGQSLEYASLIQTSFLPNMVDLYDYIPDHFLIWAQRDTVGGDAYWLRTSLNGFFLGVIDCTGHGVPGAFMTLIVTALLEKASSDGVVSPAVILSRMNCLIKDALGQNDRDAKSDDGMDCALCYVNPVEGEVVFAGANSPLYVLDSTGPRCIKGDRCGLGYVRSSREFVFRDVVVPVTDRTRFYLTSDGLVDQVGGEGGFPFGKSRFMAFMEERRHAPIAAQGAEIMHVLKEYQGDESRRDDVTVLGFELKGREKNGNQFV